MTAPPAGASLDALLDRLNVDRSHGERRPHKPLLLLVAIARLICRGERSLHFREVESELGELLRRFAPRVQQVRPGYPWWRLQEDALWEIPGAALINVNRSGDPSINDLRRTTGGLPSRFATALAHDPQLVQRVVRKVLDDHFETSWHGPVLDAVGFDTTTEIDDTATTGSNEAAELVRESVLRWRRPTAFARIVLRAYGHRCALTGYRATLDGSPIALEAAHLRWHSKGGPATIANGLALQPTLHQLLDFGAWSLDDDRRVIVSNEYLEDAAAHALLLPLCGRRVRDPEPGFPKLDLDHVRWHREPDRGGIFRG